MVPEAARLPCLTTLTPAPAATKAAAVLMLNVPRLSPPVPQVSNTSSPFTSNRIMLSRRTAAAAAISSPLSPLFRRAVKNAAISVSFQRPAIISRMAPCICRTVRSRRSANAPSDSAKKNGADSTMSAHQELRWEEETCFILEPPRPDEKP